MTQRAAGVTRSDGPVTPLELSSPRELGEDEVLIDVRAAGVGDWDELMRAGQWPSGLRPPHALGVEAAGVVGAVGRPEPRVVARPPGPDAHLPFPGRRGLG